MTVEYCAVECSAYAYFRVELAQECYCGNSFATGAAMASDPTTCNMACAGNAKETCGGANRFNVYSHAPATSKRRRRVEF
jgi:hypothetical protein